MEFVRKSTAAQSNAEKMADVKIQLVREIRFPYSGGAYITFPVQSHGHIVNDWNRVSFLSQHEREDMQQFCKTWDKIPCYVEGKLIALGYEDFEYSTSECNASA